MDTTTASVLLLLVGLSALFSGSEAALFSLNRIQIRQLEVRTDRVSRGIRNLLESPQRLLNSLLVGNTLVNIAISVTVASYAIGRFGEEGVEVGILVATVVILLFGEILPKTIAVNLARPVSRVVALPLILLLSFLRPLTWVATGMARALLQILRQPEPEGGGERRVTSSELRAVFEEIDEGTGISKLESRLVQNILFFSRTTTEEVMTPRVDITAAPITASPEELRELIVTTKHSRIPLYEKTIDAIVGYLPARGFLLDPTAQISKLIRPVLIVPEKAPVDRVFHDLRKGHWRMAIVVNEYGETVGLLTQEDLIEEIVGELSDEYERAEEEIIPIGGGAFEVRGKASLLDLSSALDVALPQEQAVTVNGFLCSLYGGFPRVGTLLRWGDLEFEVLEVARHRVQKARVRPIGQEPER